MNRINVKNVFLLLIPSLVVLLILFHWLTRYPQKVNTLIYSVESSVATLQSNCSFESPAWMEELLRFSFRQRGSLANQIAYRDKNGIIHHCEGGWANHLFGVPVNSVHRYRYASLTKLVTADLILQLIEEKKLTLDTRLVEIFPSINPVYDERINKITIGNLLDHSAGFDRLTLEGDVMFTTEKSKRWCPYNINHLAEQRLYFSPGEKQIYSNLGYCLLGAVIEKITNNPYREYARKVYQLDTLNMKFIDGAYLEDEVTYNFLFDSFYGAKYYESRDMHAYSSAAGLSGSATSFVKLVEKILLRPGLSLLEPPDRNRCRKNSGQCFGFAFDHYQINKSLQLFIHRGYLPGVSSLIVVDNYGGILVLLNAGAVPNPSVINKLTIRKINGYLQQEYKH